MSDKKDKKKAMEEKVEILKPELEEIRKKAEERDEYYNKWLNVHAEYDNTRKRMEKDKVNFARFANESLIFQLFPIVDNFDMAFAAMEKAEDKDAVMNGIRLVQKEFHKILEDNGVKKIETGGKQFDHNVHEAVFAETTSEHPDGLILEEIRAGYMLNERLLRPAQVKVAKNDD
ncbi:MAG: nucleotide exchange factor GrpE [Candidatus Omnitrophota bacterium]